MGARLRKDARSIGPAVFGTAITNLRIQGKAPARGATNPAYKLNMARSFPVAKLRASLRKVTRKGGRQSLTIAPPHQDKQHFSAVERVGRAFRLLPGRPTARRGSLATSQPAPDVHLRTLTTAGLPSWRRCGARPKRSLPETVAQQITEYFKRRRN